MKRLLLLATLGLTGCTVQRPVVCPTTDGAHYAILSLGYDCPGGLLGGLFPPHARPLFCTPSPVLETLPAAQLVDVKARVMKLGGAARLYFCDGGKCNPVPVAWSTDAIIGGINQ